MIIILALIALLPWWKNHAYLTDFYDYGLVISGAGRIGAGERLYVDFISPIQSGIFLLNAAAEKIGGGTFQAMTLGNAFLIVGATTVFVLMLARRWPLWAVMGMVGSIIWGSLSQHTIIWHNTTGVVCLALVVWSTAVAPVMRRSAWRWHLLVLVGLWLGGINKLNFHMVALAAACGWTLRAGLTGGESWRRVTGTLVIWLSAGTVLPLLTELIWTGATFQVWWHNVVELPLASRAGTLGQILTWQFQLASPHTYYGTLRLPQMGLVSIVLLLITTVAALRRGSQRGWGDRVLLFMAVLLAMGAAAALHATNFDIGYVSLSASLVLTASLWLGFELQPRGFVFWAGLVIPSILVGVVAWESAWRGQRSQFGHTSAAREIFLPAETADPAYAYLRGTYVPPEMHESLGGAAIWLHSVEHGGLHPVFYGPGTEWLERIFPAVKSEVMPLWAQWGTTYGPRELDRLHRELRSDGIYNAVLSVHAWDAWPPETLVLLDFFFSKSMLGGVIDLRQHTTRPPILRDAMAFRNQFGSNTTAAVIDFAGTPIEPLQNETNGSYLGVTHGVGKISLGVPIQRLGSEAIVQRLDGAGSDPVYADFRVVLHNSRIVRWNERLELPAGQSRISIPWLVDGSGEPVDLEVEIPPVFSQQIGAGYRNPRITDTGARIDAETAPYLRPIRLVDEPITPLDQFLPAAWRPDDLTLRSGRVTPAGIELQAGGEFWLRANGRLSELSGEVFMAENAHGSSLPIIRVVWYKGGRLEVIQQETLASPTAKFHFRAWSAEPDGWFGIMADPVAGMIPATVRILKAEPAAE